RRAVGLRGGGPRAGRAAGRAGGDLSAIPARQGGGCNDGRRGIGAGVGAMVGGAAGRAAVVARAGRGRCVLPRGAARVRAEAIEHEHPSLPGSVWERGTVSIALMYRPPEPPTTMLEFSNFARGLTAETAFDVLAVARRLKARGKNVVEL